MNNEDAKRRAKIITTLFVTFGQSSDGQRIAAYISVLQGIPVEALKAACTKLMLESRFLPTIAEIVEAARGLVGEATGNRVKSWDEAWAELQEQRKSAFIYAKPVFSTVEIRAAAEAFGWREFCCALEEERGTVHAQMRNIYLAVCARKKDKLINEHVLQHTGLLHDVANGEPQHMIRRDEDLTGLISIGKILLRNDGGKT